MIQKIVKYVNKDGFVFTFEPIEDTLKIVRTFKNKDGKAGYEVIAEDVGFLSATLFMKKI